MKAAPHVPVSSAGKEVSRFRIGQIIDVSCLGEIIYSEWEEDAPNRSVVVLPGGYQASLDEVSVYLQKNCPFFGELRAGFHRYKIKKLCRVKE